MNITRVHITTFLVVVVALWAGALVVLGVPVTLAYLAPFSIIVTILVVLFLLLQHYLWHTVFLHGWFIKRPDVRGTWKVELQSDWIDPATNQRIGPITCYMGVKQSLSALQMHLMTPESESWFVAHSISDAPSDHGYQIVGVYTNKPMQAVREKSQIHWGTVVLQTHGDSTLRPETLAGEYWTDRKTSGQLTLSSRRRKVLTRFADANAAFEKKPEKLSWLDRAGLR